MRIKTIRIENFRCFEDETIALNRYSCFVGPNGSGKSTVLAALNVFFREQASCATDTARLIDEDYFKKNTAKPARITLTFEGLSEGAAEELKDYVRQGELVVTVEAIFDEGLGYGKVRHFGQRLGMEDFRCFFDAEKDKKSATELGKIYDGLRSQFPNLPGARSKDDKASALRGYEATHPAECSLIPSEDNFYGVNSTGKLAGFVQWVYVPAVKDAGEEGQESKDTALGKLIARAVRIRTNFDAELGALRTETLTKYQELLAKNQSGLKGISEALQKRLETWAHPDVKLGMEWISDPAKAVVLQQPVAGIKTGEGDFLGSLSRMGHGLQRSYLLALLQELAGSDAPDAPTLILGCEEPELYQHPPQARHLADVFYELATGNNQVLVTTHSPLFVSGEGFENVRLVRKASPNAGSTVGHVTFERLCARIRSAKGEDLRRPTEGLVAKIHQALQPGISEMFFARVPVLVEGLEDVAYITTQLHLLGQWSEFRRLGCHLVAAGGKDKLVQPLAIAKELGMPVYVVFDADGDTKKPEKRAMHEKDNNAILSLAGVGGEPFPASDSSGACHMLWATKIADTVKKDFGAAFDTFAEPTRLHYAQEGDLEKNGLFIADLLSAAHAEGKVSPSLTKLCESMIAYATRCNVNA